MKISTIIESFIDSFSGSFGAFVATIVVYPFENIRVRRQASLNKKPKFKKLKTDKDGPESSSTNEISNVEYKADKEDKAKVDKSRSNSSIRSIVKSEGIKGLYNGLSTNLFGMLLSMAIFFWWMRFFKALYRQYYEDQNESK